ncbi:MAG: hypothetical protein MN733_07525 [Nitrososphaera sp.]|nr:hypothetical protein [Nitrososphaera sp.]
MRVHKYSFELPPYQTNAVTLPVMSVQFPKGGHILTGGVDEYSGKPSLWILVDADCAETDTVSVIVAPTGIEVPEEYNYLSTFKTNGGMLVWHMFIKE